MSKNSQIIKMPQPDREKSEKSRLMNQIKHIPKDAQVIMSILKELNVTEYEPRVINQLLEFTYRYVTCILDDAKVYANHGKKKVIDLDDVKIATQMMLDKAFTTPPSRNVLLDLSRARNNTPLPLIKPHCGLRLPPDRYCLSQCNYKLRAAAVPKKLAKSVLDSRPIIKANIKGVTTTTGIKRPSLTTTPKTQAVTIPKPVFKFSTSSAQKNPINQPNTTIIKNEIKMELDDEISILKRKREEDEFEMV